MTQPTSADSIYLTYKTRMISEANLRFTGRAYNFLITWYAFWLIVFSLANLLNIYEIPFADFLFTTYSIATFGLSLLVYGERHFEKADEFRRCYLTLQKIYKSGSSDKNKIKQYFEVLDLYPNQRDDDYDAMLFDAWCRGQHLYNSAGEVSITLASGAKVVIRRVLRWMYWAILFTVPALPVAVAIFMEPTVDGARVERQTVEGHAE